MHSKYFVEMKNTLILFMFLLFIIQINGQQYASKYHIDKINNAYTSSLELTKKESKEFRKILLKFNKELYKIDLKGDNKRLFNKTLKFQTIQIFQLLSSEQFSIYKKSVLELEPYKEYKL